MNTLTFIIYHRLSREIWSLDKNKTFCIPWEQPVLTFRVVFRFCWQWCCFSCNINSLIQKLDFFCWRDVLSFAQLEVLRHQTTASLYRSLGKSLLDWCIWVYWLGYSQSCFCACKWNGDLGLITSLFSASVSPAASPLQVTSQAVCIHICTVPQAWRVLQKAPSAVISLTEH